MQHEEFSVTTQNSLTGGGRPDMFVDYGGHRVLSEHKIDATATAYQSVGYPGWKDVHSVLIAPDVAPYRETTPFDTYLSWAEVANEVKRIGSERGGDAWRQVAVDPDQPAASAAAKRLLGFLERQNIGVVNETPIDDKGVQHYRGFEAARLQLKRFFELLREDAEIQGLRPGAIRNEERGTAMVVLSKSPGPTCPTYIPKSARPRSRCSPTPTGWKSATTSPSYTPATGSQRRMVVSTSASLTWTRLPFGRCARAPGRSVSTVQSRANTPTSSISQTSSLMGPFASRSATPQAGRPTPFRRSPESASCGSCWPPRYAAH